MMMVFLENVYYIIVITWTLFYLFQIFTDLPSLPWSDCSKGSKDLDIILIEFRQVKIDMSSNQSADKCGFLHNLIGFKLCKDKDIIYSVCDQIRTKKLFSLKGLRHHYS